METDIEKGYDNLGQEAPSVLKLLMRHKKRTLDLFLGNYGHSIPEDHMSLRAKLSSKIHDEFEAVKDLPPPKAPGSLSIPTATKSSSANHDKPNAVSKDHISRNSEQSITEPLLSTTKRFLPPPPPPLPSSTSSVEDHIKILPPHKFPSRPGIEEDISSMEKEEEITDVNAYEQVMQSLPKSKSQLSFLLKIIALHIVPYFDFQGRYIEDCPQYSFYYGTRWSRRAYSSDEQSNTSFESPIFEGYNADKTSMASSMETHACH